MPTNQEYRHIDAFLERLLARDPFAAAIEYYHLPLRERERLWNPLIDADMPRWVQKDLVLAFAEANDQGDMIARHRAYKSASPTTRPVLDRIARALH